MPPMTSTLDLWQEHKTRLRGYIAKRVRESDAVDDILQEVFLKAHASRHAVRAPGSLGAWLYRIAAHAIVDHYRARQPLDELPEELAAPEPASDPVAELASCLQPLVADLPETYQSALVLAELEGLPQKEVARRLGLSLSGAKSRIQRGREQLRQRVLACCDVEVGRNGIVGYVPRTQGCGAGCGEGCGTGCEKQK